jgi:hypothetical protein
MKRSHRLAQWMLLLLVISLLSGCLDGILNNKKTYKLTVTVLEEATDNPIQGAVVEIVGKVGAHQETDKDGKANLVGLSETLELNIEAPGYLPQSKSVVMNKDQSIVVKLAINATGTVVATPEQLAQVIADEEVESIVLASDLVLNEMLVINRPVDLNLSNKTLKGDVKYSFDDEETIELSGTGKIQGNLTVNAPNATVTNRLSVTEFVNIEEVASSTWNEYASGNKLVVLAPEIQVNIYNGAESIRFGLESWNAKLKIHGGTVQSLVAESQVRVWGADKIQVAEVNAPHVTFDLSPQEIQGDFSPTIIMSFVPGTGGTIPAWTPSTADPETFAGLYIQRQQRWSHFSSVTYPEVDMYFPSPASLDGDSYVLQYFDKTDSTWKQYDEVETSSSLSENFSITCWEETRLRLLMVGGPLNNYVSNEVVAKATNVDTYFSAWGIIGTSQYVGETVNAYAFAKSLSDGTEVDEEYFTYQWFRVDPVTMEFEAIPGATTTQYTTQDEDAGKAVIFRATGDDENIGGYIQIWAASVGMIGSAARPTLIPNKAYISDVGPNSLVLNLHKNVSGLEPEEVEIWVYGAEISEQLPVKNIEFVAGSKSQLILEVDIPNDVESLWLTAKSTNWGAVSNYPNDGAPYIMDSIIYTF